MPLPGIHDAHRIGINTEIILGLVLSGLLGWVGITTYDSALKVERLTTKLEFFMSAQDSDLRELQVLISALEHKLATDIDEVRDAAQRDNDRIEMHLNTIWPRLRTMEAAAGITQPPDGEYDYPPVSGKP